MSAAMVFPSHEAGSSGSLFSREVPLTARHLATLPAAGGNPEELLIAEEERREREDDGDERPVISRRLRRVLTDFLPPEESHLLEAYFLVGLSQSAIADGLNVIEQSLQHRLTRALTRVRWALTLQTWSRSRVSMKRAFAPILSPADTRFAIALWVCRWNQSRTAEWVGWSQSRVRSTALRIHAALKARTDDRRVRPYVLDLTKVIAERAWCMGSPQVQGRRAIVWSSAAAPGQLTFSFARAARRAMRFKHEATCPGRR
jgi:hypothetical protein